MADSNTALLSCLILLTLAVGRICGGSSISTSTEYGVNHSNSGVIATDNEHHAAIHLASWNFDYVAVPMGITLFILATTLGKIAYHHANFLSSYIPESCVLIIIGTMMGVIFYFTDLAHLNFFTPRFFFLLLLPPIILESAYGLHDRTFADNCGTIILFAVVGTILNWIVIGSILYGLSQTAMVSMPISFVSCMTFSALVVAVDPVAVLAIFDEIGVNSVLYFMVFGESLLNDAVTVVLYNMMKTFAEMGDSVGAGDVFLAIGSFFTVSLGGLAIGIVIGLVSALVSRFTNHVRVVEPLLIFMMAYFSYLCGELFHFSGIISMIGCGLVQIQYAFHNISKKSRTTVVYFSKMQSGLSEAVIFLFLGQALVTEKHTWETGFVISTLVLCLLVRFIVVFGLSFLANRIKRSVRKIGLQEQFIMSYGGLRGAVSFSLSVMLNEHFIPEKNLFMTAVVVVILFTVFFQGITIKPLVKLLRIGLQKETDLTMIDEMNTHVVDHMMAGMEEIIGSHGNNYIREKLTALDAKYLKPILQREPVTEAEAIMIMYEQVCLENHMLALPGSEVARRNQRPSPADENTQKGETPVKGGLARPTTPLRRLPSGEIAQKLTFANAAHDVIRRSRKEKRQRPPPVTAKAPDSRGQFKIIQPSSQQKLEERENQIVVQCLRKWKPEAINRRYDRNLVTDHDDLEQQLRIKKFVTERMSHSYAGPSRAHSVERDEQTESEPKCSSATLKKQKNCDINDSGI